MKPESMYYPENQGKPSDKKLMVYREPILGERVEVSGRVKKQEVAKTWEAIARLSAYPKMFEKLKGIQAWFDSLPKDKEGRIF